ncbi:MAG: amidohydrolase family protein, partial [Halieaceae bacterium]|nr:amidohydrolase family protein [Halieaceae bacterium]
MNRISSNQFSIVTGLLLSLITSGFAGAENKADVIYTNAVVYTVDSAMPKAEAFAVKDGKFLAVGKQTDISKYQGNKTTVVDLKGRFVLPGLVEDHIHPDMVAENRMNVEIYSPHMSYEHFSELVIQFQRDNPTKKWVFGGPINWLQDHGADIDVWNKPSHHSTLDALITDRLAFFWDLGGHAALINKVTMDRYGIDRNWQPPKGGSFDVDADGNPTGVLRETAANLIWEEFLKDRPDVEELAVEGFEPVLRELNSLGFTSITDVWARPWNLETYAALEKKGNLTTRVTAYLTDPIDWTSDWLREMSEAAITSSSKYNSDMIDYIGIKFVMDGSAGGQTAKMVDAFEGTDNTGYWRNDPDYFKRKIVEYDKMGLTVRAHAVGDQAVRTVLDGIELTRKSDSTLRHSVSHTVFVNPEDLGRFKALDAHAEVSPYFWMPDPAIETIRADVGDERLEWIFPIGMLIERGVTVSTGSDMPVSPPSPWPA